MFRKKKNKVDLARVAFFNGEREITYGQFSTDITATVAYLEKEIPSGAAILGISNALGPYLHWVLHAACTIRGIPTLALRKGQPLLEGTLVAGPVDPNYEGPTLFFDHATLATARSGQKNDKGKGFDKFVDTLHSNKSAINRILLTSGSTGMPKAVPITNSVVIARYELGVQQLPLSPDDKVLWSLGYDTAGGFNGPIEALLTGATVLLHLQKSGPETFGVLLRRSTRFTTVPSILALIMERIADPLEGAHKRVVMTTGSRLEPKLAERCRQIVGSDLRSFYGSTEVGAVSEIVGEQIQEEAGNVGKLYPGVEVEFDAGTGEQRVPGLLRFKSPWMAPGYWKEGRIEPFEDGWFSPGDMGYLNDNGELIVAGRNDDVLNYNGEKFDAVATESRIKALAEIEDAFVTVVSLRSRDWLVVMAVSQLEPQLLKERLATVLTRARFSMLKVPQIPRNHMGKLERERLTDYCQRQLGEYLDRA